MELQLWNIRTWNPFGLQIHKMCPRVALSFSYNTVPHIFKFHPHISPRPQTVSLPPKQPLSGQNVYKEVPCKKSRLSRTYLRHSFLANIIIYTSGKFHANPCINNSSMDVPFLQLNSKLKGFNFIKEKKWPQNCPLHPSNGCPALNSGADLTHWHCPWHVGWPLNNKLQYIRKKLHNFSICSIL